MNFFEGKHYGSIPFVTKRRSPRKCSAKIKCEYASTNDGAGVEHYDNKADAMKAYEKNMANDNDIFQQSNKKKQKTQ